MARRPLKLQVIAQNSLGGEGNDQGCVKVRRNRQSGCYLELPPATSQNFPAASRSGGGLRTDQVPTMPHSLFSGMLFRCLSKGYQFRQSSKSKRNCFHPELSKIALNRLRECGIKPLTIHPTYAYVYTQHKCA